MSDPVNNTNSFNFPLVERLSPQNISSPLKRKRPSDSDVSTVAVAIFKPKAARCIFPIESNESYLSEFPDALKIAAEKIEQACVNQPQSPMYLSLIRSLILDITKNKQWTETRKLAELGIIYYYIVANKRINASHNSMVKMRLLDIETEVLKLKSEHQLLKNKELKKLFPSGTIAYLLRCFVRMIFTPDGQFNLGGCHAVHELLNTRLAIFLSEEHRSQILCVTKKLIEDSNFRDLFKDPFAIHPELEELILIDMKLSSDEKMHFIYVRWDLLMALFTEVGGQYTGEKNCYAIATASNMMLNHCEIILAILIDVLKTGTFLIDHHTIPILPLLESRRKYIVDFQQTLSDKAAENLVAFSVANAVLRPVERATQTSQIQLGQKMESHFGTNAAYAKEIFLSHKQNFLQQIIIALFEFQGVNGGSIRSFDDLFEFSWRGLLFGQIYQALEQSFKPAPILTEILNKVNDELFNHFFLVDYLSWNVGLVDNKIVFDFQSQGLLFDPTVNYVPFRRIQRLFFLKDNKFSPVDTIDDFNQSLIEIAQMIKQSESRSVYQKSLDVLMLFLQKDNWKKRVAHSIIYNWNRENSNLDASIYENSNSFFLLQCGGYIEAVGQWVYKKSLLDSKRSIKSAVNVKALFLQICKEINDFNVMNTNVFNHKSKKILAATNFHVFNLTPYKFKKYWEEPTLVNQTIIAPAQKMWQQHLTDQEKVSILQTICNEQVTQYLLSNIPQGSMSLRSFRKEIMQYLVLTKHHQLTEAIETHMQKIDINAFREDIKSILDKLNITLDQKEESRLTASLKKKSEKSGNTLFAPHQLAKFMHKALILSPKHAVFIPQEVFEDEICTLYGLPHRIELGSLNWVMNLVEKPHEDRLLLKYDVDLDDIALFFKSNNFVKILDKEFTEDFLKETYFFLPF